MSRRSGVPVAALCLLALWPVGRWLVDGATAVAFPYPLDYGEGPLLDQALRLASLENIYPPLDAGGPWTVSNYPPVYPAVVALFAALGGPSFGFGRWVSFVSAALAALVVATLVRRLTGDGLAALASSLLLLASPYLAFWSTLQRVDLLALALSLGAVGWLVQDGSKDGEPSIWPAVALLVAATLTRQTFALTVPGALTVWLLAQGQLGRALRLAAGFVGASLTAVAVLQWTTGGFLDHVVTANWNPWALDLLVDHAREASRLFIVPVAATVLALALGLVSPRADGPDRPALLFVATYFALSIVSAAAIGKIGSNVNYLLEFSVAAALGSGLFLARWRRDAVRSWILVALLASQIVTWLPETRHEVFASFHRSAESETTRLLSLVAGASGPVATDEWLGLLPLVGKRVELQPFERTHLAASGAWNPAEAGRWLREGRAELVLLFRPDGMPGLWTSRWSPEMRRALEEAYVVRERIGSTDVLVPRRASPLEDGAPVDGPSVDSPWGDSPSGNGL